MTLRCLRAISCAVAAAVTAAPGSAADAALATPAPASLALRAARCELDAVGEAIASIRTTDAALGHPHVEALRTAGGRCARFVLALAPLHQVPRLCAAPEALTAAQTARELRRRMAAIDADALLRSSVAGRACRAAYLHELKTTRARLNVNTP
jgi:hypothetical protein